MHNMLQPQHAIRIGRPHFFRGVGMSLMLALALCGTALGQQIQVSGFVTTADGTPIQGVIVSVQQTDIRTTTAIDGRYSLTAPADGVLLFNLIGYRAISVGIAGRTTVDVVLERSVAVLDELVVTGYTTQRRAEITGAVSSADLESVNRQSGASVLKALDGRVPGVTVESSGSPGSRSTVRVRGISSFQNNDPLYIIDGTPTEGTYLNFLNSEDIESIQVLKDASAASIYGSRANNGVIIIETKKGSVGAPQITVDAKVGMATPTRGYDDFLILDALEYHEIIRRAHVNAGLPVPENIYGDPNNPSIPRYIFPNDGVSQTTDVDESTYSFPDNLIMPGSAGTNWWDAVFGPAFVGDFNLNVSGGTAESRYNISFNYLNQEGTAAFNRFQRGTARVNTEFNVGRVRVGESFAVAVERGYGGLDDGGGSGEDNILGKNILMQPVIPVYDVGGNFASGKSATLGNQSNPLKFAALDGRDDIVKNTRVIGNVFAGIDLLEGLSFTTRLGFNLNDFSLAGFTPIYPEDSEPNFVNGINEQNTRTTDWTWNNVLNYARTFESHSIAALLGHEANEVNSRTIVGSLNNLITTDVNARYIQDAVGDPSTKNVSSTGGEGSLVSVFGKIDYNFANRYHLSFTLRRDGSSRLGPANRWGTFPAIGAGWRLSQESFLAGSPLFTNLMLRFGWGITGNQNIPTGRTVSEFGGGRGDTFYAIGGGDALSPGFRQVSLGNDSLKWEENQSINVGMDVELGGRFNLIVDVYQRNTDNLLFDPQQPATAGVAAPPILNIGEMRNRGFDLSIAYRGTIGDEISWSFNLNGSHYKNKIVRIDGVSDFFFGYGGAAAPLRAGNPIINQVGFPIGSFYGYEADGFFLNQAEVDAHASQGGAAPGRIRFKDQLTIDTDGDGVPDERDNVINAEDRTVIGNPHPDFTAGLDLEFRWRNWDFSATLFGSFGNDIFEAQKNFYVFRDFSTNVRRDLLTNSAVVENGQVTNPDAKYPRLDQNDVFSRDISSFWVEDGTYVRLRNLQIGYTLPRWIPGLRMFVQAENLFTITGYPGLDPALPARSQFGPAGDTRDQHRGIDVGLYPSNRIISFGLTATFSGF